MHNTIPIVSCASLDLLLNLLCASPEKEGRSWPRQLASTNRYLYKVHWWIYSLSLTTGISNNLSQMPGTLVDISPASTPNSSPTLFRADVSFTSLSVNSE